MWNAKYSAHHMRQMFKHAGTTIILHLTNQIPLLIDSLTMLDITLYGLTLVQCVICANSSKIPVILFRPHFMPERIQIEKAKNDILSILYLYSLHD